MMQDIAAMIDDLVNTVCDECNGHAHYTDVIRKDAALRGEIVLRIHGLKTALKQMTSMVQRALNGGVAAGFQDGDTERLANAYGLIGGE